MITVVLITHLLQSPRRCQVHCKTRGNLRGPLIALCQPIECRWLVVTTNASFCLFICAFVFASNSGHFRITVTSFCYFFTPLLLLNYFLFNLFVFLQKSGGPPSPGISRSPPLMNFKQHLHKEFMLCRWL